MEAVSKVNKYNRVKPHRKLQIDEGPDPGLIPGPELCALVPVSCSCETGHKSLLSLGAKQQMPSLRFSKWSSVPVTYSNIMDRNGLLTYQSN